MLYLVWKANDGSNRIYISGTKDPLVSSNWPKGVAINGNDSTSATPGAVTFNNKLYLVWTSSSISNTISVSSNNDPTNGNWPDGQLINQVDSTSAAPNLGVVNNSIYLTWKANDQSNTIFVSTTKIP